jgi:hypothetical protein
MTGGIDDATNTIEAVAYSFVANSVGVLPVT